MTPRFTPLLLIFSFLLPATIDAQPRIRITTPFVSLDASLPLWIVHTAVVHHDEYTEDYYGYGYDDEVEEIRHNADHMFADLEAEAMLHDESAREFEAMPELEALEDETSLENFGTMEPEPVVPSNLPSAHTGDGFFSADMEAEILQLINAERADHGLEPLRPSRELREAARQHSREMNELSYFSHESPVEAYQTLPMRLRNAGVAKFGWAGENIAMSTAASAERFVQMWMDSPGHRANILKPEFEFSGIGVYGSGSSFHATQVFSSSR